MHKNRPAYIKKIDIGRALIYLGIMETKDNIPNLSDNPEASHPFERAGLGAPPYRFLGAEHVTYQAVKGDPNCPVQPGGSCDFCGLGIYDQYHFRSSNGKTFKVGCDCALKALKTAKDFPSQKLVDRERRKLERNKRHAREELKIEALLAQWNQPEVQAWAKSTPSPNPWRAKEGDTYFDYVEYAVSVSGNSGKLRNLLAALNEYKEKK